MISISMSAEESFFVPVQEERGLCEREEKLLWREAHKRWRAKELSAMHAREMRGRR